MATYSSTLAWKIPWTEEPGRLQSMGSLRVGHDWSDLAAAAAAASRTVSAENACVLLRVPICADILQPQGVNPLVISWTDSSGLLESREGKGFPLQYSGLENFLNYIPWGCKESDTTEWLSLLLWSQQLPQVLHHSRSIQNISKHFSC